MTDAPSHTTLHLLGHGRVSTPVTQSKVTGGDTSASPPSTNALEQIRTRQVSQQGGATPPHTPYVKHLSPYVRTRSALLAGP